ncbi:MAG: hypothetical protein J6C37_09105 [Roseburia sp.]|nr:hypothetical protein [Roseburia sp.]
MKKQILYQCEYCGTQFNDEKKALECEGFHHTAKEIKNASYHRAMSIRDGYPDVLMVKFENGEVERYKRIS